MRIVTVGFNPEGPCFEDGCEPDGSCCGYAAPTDVCSRCGKTWAQHIRSSYCVECGKEFGDLYCSLAYGSEPILCCG